MYGVGRFPARVLARALVRSESGSVIIFTLFLLVMILMVAGMSVDLMASEMQRARLQSTLDRAVLAGASLEQTLDSEDVVRDYFDKAGLGDYLTDVQIIPGANSKTVNASAHMSYTPAFMRMLGVNQLSVPAAGQAKESLSNIEISLVLDVSGSMSGYSLSGGASKIELLRTAANDFVRLMQCDPDDSATCTVDPGTVSISLVPYAEQVLVGENLIQHFNVTNEHTGSSCVDFDASAFSNVSISLTDTLYRAAEIDNRTNYRSSRSYSRAAYDSRRTCRTESYRQILPFEDDYTQLQAQINQLQADGYTSIDMGMKWGAALLHPDFRPAVTSMTTGGLPAVDAAFAGRPFDFDQRSNQKVIVLMTDGENTTQYVLKDWARSGLSPIWRDPDDGDISAYRASTGKYWSVDDDDWDNAPDGGSNDNAVQLTWPEFWADYNVDFYEEALWFLPDPTDVYGYTPKNARLDQICTQAKAVGIEVFTIGFETSSASNQIMQACASSDAHHFDVDGIDLDDAFRSIAREIHELRLTL